MSLIAHKDIPQVAMAFMNDVHTEDVDIINKVYERILGYLEDASAENAAAIDVEYENWYGHTLDHFEGEEIKMLELNFPPYGMHKNEHDKALQRMESIYRSWKQNRDIIALKHYIAEEIPLWLTTHIQTMDTVTALFFQQQLSTK